MTDVELARLLHSAADTAETAAPPVDPLAALACGRRRREQRRGHLVALAFVAFVVLLQLVPAEALGASGPAQAGTVVAAQTRGSPADEVPDSRG
jgi:hypothetical protein